MTALRLLFALMLTAAVPSLAGAQDAADQADGDQAPPQQQDAASAPAPADPVEALQGLWHVDRAEGGAASETMVGGILKIDRQAVASLSGGTCSSPGFAAAPGSTDPEQVGVDITCLGWVLASARWSRDDPDEVSWSEPDLDVVLHRVKSAATAQQPADDGVGDDGAGDDNAGEDDGQ
ncbi:MAG TPA: hypothetical protein VHA35_17645 [Dongiaceae bacterium]|nr:hypothetical protein [Dongiaceae bacterium]